MANLPHITESEWLIMNTLWERSPRTAADIVKTIQAEKDLENTTIRTLLRRLIAKKAVSYTIDDKNSKLYYYTPLVSQNDCVVKESRHFLSLYYRNNVGKLFATFVDNADMSGEEIDSLKQLLERKKVEADEDLAQRY